MPTIKRFEDLQSWQKARELTKAIYVLTSSAEFRKDFGLKDQIRRAAVSIMLNLAEGFARRTDRDFSRFLAQAHGSAAEVQSALYIALDQNYIKHEQFENLYAMIEECSRMIQAFANYLNTYQRQKPSMTPRLPDS